MVQSYGLGGVHDDLPSTKLYEGREQFELRNQEEFEQKLKEISESEENKAILMNKKLWERELEEEEGDSSYDDELDESPNNSDPEEKMEDTEMKDETKYKGQAKKIFKE